MSVSYDSRERPAGVALPVAVTAVNGHHVDCGPAGTLTHRLSRAGVEGGTVELTGATVVVGGREQRGDFCGLVYVDTDRWEVSAGAGAAGEGDGAAGSDGAAGTGPAVGIATATGSAGTVTLDWTYRPQAGTPFVRLDVTVSAREETILRGLDLTFRLHCPGAARIQAPGNRIRPGLPLAELAGDVQVYTAGAAPGSAGLVALEQHDPGVTAVVWPVATQAVGASVLSRDGDALGFRVETHLAAALAAGESVSYGPVYLGVVPSDWTRLRADFPDWYDAIGLRLPQNLPAWAGAASIYEVQIGTSLFGGIADYTPYPTAADLLADLPRIADLGFDALQIMPRQPFPSYNVVDYADVDISYGDRETLGAVVQEAHRRGMRVILDVILHGVLDRASIRQAAEQVRAGAHGDFLRSHTWYSAEDAAALPEAFRLPWSRHILDFENAWRDGSVETHPWVVDHPQWFRRDNAGNLTGIYTWAFEHAEPSWQQHFSQAMISLLDELQVDGFRFDAPTYAEFANWSPDYRAHASASELAAIGLFRRLREEILTAHPGTLFYTEPSGVLLRQSMDVNYNYDEHSQIEDFLGRNGFASGTTGFSTAGVRNAHELMAWLAERDASLPRGAVTAHHIDSHDTFWWPRPGLKWRREQIGIDAARALLSILSLVGGPFMTFTGGELGMEAHLTAIHRIRRQPEFASGAADFTPIVPDHPQVFSVVRTGAGERSIVLVNMSPAPVAARLRDADRPVPAHAWDLLTGRERALPAATLNLGGFETVVLSPSAPRPGAAS